MERMTKAQAREYIATRSDEFRADIYDRSMRQKDVAKKHHISNGKACQLRMALFGRQVKQLDMNSPRVLRIIHDDITSIEAAKQLGVSWSTVTYWRQKFGIPVKHTPPLRLTSDVLAMLRSQLPEDVVARALNVAPTTVRKHRRELRGGPSRVTVTKAELEAMIPEILAAKTGREAVRKLGIGYATVTTIRRRHGIGRARRRTDLPTDPEWYATKTLPEIAEQLGTSIHNASYMIRSRGLTFKSRKRGSSHAQRKARSANRANG